MARILNIISKKKKTLILVLGLGLLLSLVPIQQAYAFPWDSVVNAIRNLPISIPALVVAIPVFLITMVISFLSTAISSVIIIFVQNLMQIGITPAHQEFVAVGWAICRDLVNMVFILLMVFIGLATILRIRDYEAKRLLPTLIIIAVLVNFSGVVVGFVVDMGNIITNAFLSHTTSFSSLIYNLGENFAEKAGALVVAEISDLIPDAIGLILETALNAIYYLVLILILFVVLLLFLARVVILWILAILAPIAFGCYILPATRKFFGEWFQNLIQWSILGIPIAFFLFLASVLIGNICIGNDPFTGVTSDPAITDALSSAQGSYGEPSFLANFFTKVLSKFVVLAIVILGVMLSMKMAPAGASGIINFGKSVPGKLAKTRLGQRALGGLASGAQKALDKTARFAHQADAGLSKRHWGKFPIGAVAGGWLTRSTSWATKGINRWASPALIEYAAKREKMSMPEGFDKWTAAKQEAWINAKNLDSTDLLTAGAKMGGNLEYASGGLNDKVKTARDAIFAKVNPSNFTGADEKALSYMEEAKAVSKTFPELSEDIRTKMKVVGKQGYSRENALRDVKKDIQETADFIENSLSPNDLAIEAGLKLDYITKEDVDKNRTTAAAKSLLKLTPKQADQFLKDVAAGATYVREFKGADISKIADVKSLSTRAGIVLGNPANLQRVVDEHGKAALDNIINGAAGLNNATSDPVKLDTFNKLNPKMIKAIFTNPAMRYIDCEAKKQMLDIDGQHTNDFSAYERKNRMKEAFDATAGLEKFYKDIRAKELVIENDSKLYQVAKRNKMVGDMKRLETEMNAAKDHIFAQETSISPTLKDGWNKINALRKH